MGIEDAERWTMALRVMAQVKKGLCFVRTTGREMRFESLLAAWMALVEWMWWAVMGVV